MAVGIPGNRGRANRSAHVETCSAHAGPAQRQRCKGLLLTLPGTGRAPRQGPQVIARQFAHAA
jgi:hypothetical protein